MATVEKKTMTITSKLTSDGEVFVHYLLQLRMITSRTWKI
jgi:hypothetical protein